MLILICLSFQVGANEDDEDFPRDESSNDIIDPSEFLETNSNLSSNQIDEDDLGDEDNPPGLVIAEDEEDSGGVLGGNESRKSELFRANTSKNKLESLLGTSTTHVVVG